jgi:hypothetical protein
METVISSVVALCMFIAGELQEHRIQESMSDCLKGKRLAERDVNVNIQYMCGTVEAELEENIDGSISIKKNYKTKIMNLSKNKLIKKIVIVGGGSSGWLTAAYLSNNFPNLNITVIDKEIGTPVGVGEATILNFPKFLQACGFNLEEWYSELDATEKLGILFPNWIDNNKDISHPFFVSKTNSKNYSKDYKERLEIKITKFIKCCVSR